MLSTPPMYEVYCTIQHKVQQNNFMLRVYMLKCFSQKHLFSYYIYSARICAEIKRQLSYTIKICRVSPGFAPVAENHGTAGVTTE